MERDRRDLLNPNPPTFHLSLFLLRTKIFFFFLSQALEDPGWNLRDYSGPYVRVIWSSAFEVRSGINLLQQLLGHSGPQDSECTGTYFSK